MNRRTVLAHLTAVALLASFTATSQALPTHANSNFDIGPSKGEVTGVIVGIAATGAAIGFGIYFAVHHNQSLTGCAAAGPDGPMILNEGDQQSYKLIGVTTGITPGDRIKIAGKRQKHEATNTFLVTRLARDYGACGGKR